MGTYKNARRYKTRSKRVKKVTALTRKGASSQAGQIIKLQRQVDLINRNVRDNTKWTQYQFPLLAQVGQISAPGYITWNLIQPDLWTPVFQTRSQDQIDEVTPSKFRGRSIGLELIAQLGQLEEIPMSFDPIINTIFIVSLRKETAQQFKNETANGTNLLEGVHYVKTNLGTLQGEGLIMLNKGYFKIRHVKRFMLGGNVDFYNEAPDDLPVKTTNLKDNNRRFYIKLPYRNLIKDAGPNNRASTAPAGFKTMTINEIEPLDQLFVFLFSNAYADQQLEVHANMVITGTTAN